MIKVSNLKNNNLGKLQIHIWILELHSLTLPLTNREEVTNSNKKDNQKNNSSNNIKKKNSMMNLNTMKTNSSNNTKISNSLRITFPKTKTIEEETIKDWTNMVKEEAVTMEKTLDNISKKEATEEVVVEEEETEGMITDKKIPTQIETMTLHLNVS